MRAGGSQRRFQSSEKELLDHKWTINGPWNCGDHVRENPVADWCPYDALPEAIENMKQRVGFENTVQRTFNNLRGQR